MKIARLIAVLFAGVLLAAGCGEDRGASSTSTSSNSTSTTSESESGNAEVEVGLNEWKVIVEAPNVAAGKVKFEGDNEGKVPHELIVLKTDTKADALKVDGAKAKEEGENLGQASDIAPGDKKDVEVDLEPG